MYIIKKIDFDEETKEVEVIVGVVNGDESKAIEWIGKHKNDFKIRYGLNNMYPYYKPVFVKELK